MTLTDNQKDEIAGMIAILIVTSIIFLFGWMFGDIHGYERSMEDTKKYECLAKYNSIAYKNIEGKCLKYFSAK